MREPCDEGGLPPGLRVDAHGGRFTRIARLVRDPGPASSAAWGLAIWYSLARWPMRSRRRPNVSGAQAAVEGQEIRVLRERIRSARAARSEALQADHVLRESVRELDQASETLRAQRVEREQQRLLIERITQLLPVRERMDQAAKLEAEAGAPGALRRPPRRPFGGAPTARG